MIEGMYPEPQNGTRLVKVKSKHARQRPTHRPQSG